MRWQAPGNERQRRKTSGRQPPQRRRNGRSRTCRKQCELHWASKQRRWPSRRDAGRNERPGPALTEHKGLPTGEGAVSRGSSDDIAVEASDVQLGTATAIVGSIELEITVHVAPGAGGI